MKTAIKTQVATTTLEEMAIQYSNARETVEALESKMKELREQAKALMGDETSVPTAKGTWSRYVSSKMSWTLKNLKDACGRQWTSFVTPDTKLVRDLLDAGDERSKMLRKSAKVVATEVISLK